jgi:hypothetical protein
MNLHLSKKQEFHQLKKPHKKSPRHSVAYPLNQLTQKYS